MKESKNTLIYVGVFLSLFIVGSLFLVLCFRLHFLSRIDILFYRGILLILLWGMVLSLILYFLKQKIFSEMFLPRDIVWFFVVFCAIHLVYFTHVPVTAERSISVFMLGTMSDNSEQTFSEEEMEDFFIERYVEDFGAFEKRFHEQVETGTIEEVATGEYRITESGKKLMRMYETVADWYQIDDRLIHPNKESNG